MPTVDMTQWPLWVVITLFVLITFRKEIFSFLPVAIQAWFRGRQRDEARNDRIEEKILDTRLELLTRENDRQCKKEEEYLQLLKAQTSLIEKLVLERLNEISLKQDDIMIEMKREKRALMRLADLIAILYSRIDKSDSGDIITDIVSEIEGIIDDNGKTSPISDSSATKS